MKRGSVRMAKPSYLARLIANNTSAVSLSFSTDVVAARRSLSSSRIRSRYQDGGDWRGKCSSLCQRCSIVSLIVGGILFFVLVKLGGGVVVCSSFSDGLGQVEKRIIVDTAE